ncbi:ABC transporter ATP-binding protein [Rhizobium helianthi]|uniref:ABC transporter ATP-binding protein n=1 Tax=Rhizobium helianthi TaxID=1132695 RepID=A0ABW4LY64_9HYPH
MNAISLFEVSKRFGWGERQVQALTAVSLDVPEAAVYGLLGPNGAGKSTLLRIICGLIKADHGQISLFEKPADAQGRAKLGTLIESPTFYPYMTAAQFLAVLANVSGLRPDLDVLFRRVDLSHARDQKISGFSLGMRQRLGVAAALIARPQAVIFDEPTNGLDPDGMIEMRSLIQDLAKQEGIAVLLSSHLLDEVEKVADQVAILSHGEVVSQGRVSDLLGGNEYLWLDAKPHAAVLDRLGDTAWVEGEGIGVNIERSQVPDLLKSLVLQGFDIHQAKWVRPNLEALFLAQTRNERNGVRS